MHGTNWMRVLALTLGIGFMGCGSAEEMEETSSALSIAPEIDPTWGDEGSGPLTPAFWEDADICDGLRGFEACTTLAWEVCGTFVPPDIY